MKTCQECGKEINDDDDTHGFGGSCAPYHSPVLDEDGKPKSRVTVLFNGEPLRTIRDFDLSPRIEARGGGSGGGHTGITNYVHSVHLWDSANYSYNAAKVTRPPPRDRGRFMLLSPALAGELEPDALVLFDRDLADKIVEPVFLAGWGVLYVGSLASHGVCWAWNGDEWDDISDGMWSEPYGTAWMDCMDAARKRHRTRA